MFGSAHSPTHAHFKPSAQFPINPPIENPHDCPSCRSFPSQTLVQCPQHFPLSQSPGNSSLLHSQQLLCSFTGQDG